MHTSIALVSILHLFNTARLVHSLPEKHQDIKLEPRARTTTVTETETRVSTATKTITKTKTTTYSPTCVPSDDGSDVGPTTSTAVTGASSPSATSDVVPAGKCYSVPGVGTFATRKTYDFTSGELPSDLQVSDYNVSDTLAGNPWNHGFRPSNVFISDGLLHLVVPGEQNPTDDPDEAIWGGEIYTGQANILYGSIRTVAIFDDTPGTCQANPSPDEPPVFWYTNQPGGRSDNQVTGPAPTDVATQIHEYRIDWTSKWTKFYIDGVLQRTLKGTVPHVGSQWVWNNWANGSPDWSTGPPAKDNDFKIKSITMYYNTTDGDTCEE